MYAICTVPVAPIRHIPDHSAEMTSQLVFGEFCEVLEPAANGFYRITCSHDGYVGFCMGNQLMMNVEAPDNNKAFFTGWSNRIFDAAGHPMILPFGARWTKALEGKFMVGDSTLNPATYTLEENKLKAVAGVYLNTPYLWGGRSVFGADCSGFVQVVMGIFGYALPRNASEQFAVHSSPVRREGSCGDLAFFEADGRIVHVGILLAKDQVIHAFGKVRIDTLDETGIWNPEMQAYSHHLAGIRALR